MAHNNDCECTVCVPLNSQLKSHSRTISAVKTLLFLQFNKSIDYNRWIKFTTFFFRSSLDSFRYFLLVVIFIAEELVRHTHLQTNLLVFTYIAADWIFDKNPSKIYASHYIFSMGKQENYFDWLHLIWASNAVIDQVPFCPWLDAHTKNRLFLGIDHCKSVKRNNN